MVNVSTQVFHFCLIFKHLPTTAEILGVNIVSLEGHEALLSTKDAPLLQLFKSYDFWYDNLSRSACWGKQLSFQNHVFHWSRTPFCAKLSPPNIEQGLSQDWPLRKLWISSFPGCTFSFYSVHTRFPTALMFTVFCPDFHPFGCDSGSPATRPNALVKFLCIFCCCLA